MQNDIAVLVGPLDGRNRRKVTFSKNGREYTDTLDIESGFHREGAVKRACEALGIDEPNPSSLGIDLTRLAKETDEQASKGIEYRRLSCAELATGDYHIDYFIPNILPTHQPTILAGPKKAMKTSLLVDMALSVATGKPFLGFFHVEQTGRVGLMSGESGLPVLQETAARVAAAAGLNLADIDTLVVSPDLPKLGHLDHVEAVTRFMANDSLDLLILDPLYLALPTTVDAASLFAVGETLRSIAETCSSCGCSLVIAHHTRKNGKADEYGPGELADLAWSGSAEFARAWVLVNRREAYTPGTGQHRLWLSTGGSAGHGGCWAIDVEEGTRETVGGRFWQVTVADHQDAIGEAEQRKETIKADKAAKIAAARLDSDKQRIVNVMVSYPNGETPNIIKAAAGLSGERFNPALGGLIRDGYVEPARITKSNRIKPYDGFRLTGKDAKP